MNNSFLGLGLMFFILNGCSQFYGNQSPAPVFGRSTGTNPYEKQTAATTTPYQRKGNVFNSEFKSEELPLNNEDRIDEQQQVIIKRKSSPAVLALVSDADRSSKAGDLESAVVTIERALRIDPRNPALTYKLAKLRLQQSKPRLAEDLAKKAALLSANDRALKKKSWLFIGEARKRQKKYYGAKEAEIKANSL